MDVGSLISARRWFIFVWIIAILSHGAAFAEESTLVEFDIDAQELGDALTEFGVQSGTEVYFVSADVAGVQAPRIEGEYSAIEVIQQLLGTSGVEYFIDGNGTLLVGTAYTAGTTSNQRGASDSKNLTPQPMLMAQNQTQATSNRTQEDNHDLAFEEVEVETRGQIETIVVVGSRNAGIRRYEDDAQPYVIFDAVTIETSNASNLEEFLKTRLPQNATQQTFSQNPSLLFSNQSSIDLRGIGADETLILVNGRRMPSVSSTGEFAQTDINGIPLSAVERIEILPATAAGIYGGGATGGAINIILKRDYSGFELILGYENTFDTDAPRRRIEASAGFSLEGGRTNILFTAGYSDSDDLLVGDRDFVDRGRSLFLANDPEGFANDFFPPLSTTANIRTAFGGNLILDDGTDLGSNITFAPIGYEGLASDSGAAFLANAGLFNLENSLSGARASLSSAPQVSSLALSVRRDFLPRLEGYVDLSFYNNKGRTVSGADNRFAFLAADNPNNPFDSFITVTYPVTQSEFPASSETETLRSLAGIKFQLTDDWAAQLEYGWGQTETRATSFLVQQNADYGVAVFNGEIDPYRDPNEFPIDTTPFNLGAPSLVNGPFTGELSNASFRITGSGPRLGGGPIAISSLLEHRRDKKDGGFTDQTQLLFDPVEGLLVPVNVTTFFPEREQSVLSAYVEALLPLVSSANDRVGLEELELQLAIRHDDYKTTSQREFNFIQIPNRDASIPDFDNQNTSVSSTDVTLGIRYRPIDSLLLRASLATGFLPPNIDQVVPSSRLSEMEGAFLTDPKRGGVQGTNTLPIEVIQRGNPDLVPEESESISVGLVWMPRIIDGLRISADYVRIKKDKEISSALNTSNIFEFEDQFPDRVTREALTPEDAALGYTAGEVVALDISLVNIAKSTVDAYDFQVDYSFSVGRFGQFDAFAVATLTNDIESQILPTSPTVDRVGFADGPLRWRANFGVTWQHDDWRVGWSTQYFDSYRIYSSTASDADIERLVLRQGASEISSQTYHDLYVRYTFDKALDGVELQLGIQNLFDASPPIVATSSDTGGYSFYGDPRLRRYTLEFKMGF